MRINSPGNTKRRSARLFQFRIPDSQRVSVFLILNSPFSIPTSALFLVFAFFRRTETCGGTERLAVIEHRKILDVQPLPATRGLLIHYHGNGAAFDAFPECHATSASQPRMSEPFHRPIILHVGFPSV